MSCNLLKTTSRPAFPAHFGSVLIWNSPECWHGKSLYQPGRLVSLWEMMSASSSEICKALTNLEYNLKHLRALQGKLPDKTSRVEILRDSEIIEAVCKKFELTTAASRFSDFRNYLSAQMYETTEAAIHQLYHAREAFMTDLHSKKFVFIPADKVAFFQHKKPFGDLVFKTFPTARTDAKEASSCLAVDLSTAAVFHLMRVTEVGLFALAKRMKVSKVGKVGKKQIPITDVEWGRIIDALDKKLVGGTSKRGPVRKEKNIHYRHLLIECRAIKDLWRNPVSHSIRPFNANEARGIKDHVKEFMERVAILTS